MTERKVLIVEDDEAVRELFEHVFQNAGFKVSSAENAADALLILEQENILVMFLDLNLPDMDGLELCKQIRKNNSAAAIFAVTAYSSLFEHAKCLEAGFNNYFRKPVDTQLLIYEAEKIFETENV